MSFCLRMPTRSAHSAYLHDSSYNREQARAWLAKMAAAGVRPTIRTYSTLANAYAKAIIIEVHMSRVLHGGPFQSSEIVMMSL